MDMAVRENLLRGGIFTVSDHRMRRKRGSIGKNRVGPDWWVRDSGR